jgi:uncharacterized protein (DUF2147 family)
LKLVLVGLAVLVVAAAAPDGDWRTADGRGVIRIEPCNGELCGRIVGVGQVPAALDVNGASTCGLVIVRHLVPDEDGKWRGSITNPESGRVWSTELSVQADGTLHLRGYVGNPLFGSTQIWPPYAGTLGDDCRMAD